MTRMKIIILPDGTRKIEKNYDTPEQIEAKNIATIKMREEKRKRNMYHKNKTAINHGYKNNTEYVRAKNWENGIHKPCWLNKDCPPYLGIYIAENLLPDIFESPKMMPNNNIGFDAICSKGHKIDVKSACLKKRETHTNNCHLQ